MALVGLTRWTGLNLAQRLGPTATRLAPLSTFASQSELGRLAGASSVIGGAGFTLSVRHVMRDYRLNYVVKRAPPLGPHRLLAPNQRDGKRKGPKGNYKRIIHYPEDGQYTIKKLPVTKLGGRNPETGRKVIQRFGGGSKQKYRWIDWRRLPADWNKEEDYVERVLSLNYDPCRDARIMLTGHGEKLRWQIATTTVQEGDLIRANGRIPPNPVRPIEGDSYPLGALPAGTSICLVQWGVGSEEVKIIDGGMSGKVLRKVGDKVVIKSSNNFDYSLHESCQCVVGTVMKEPLKALEIGSPQRARWLGIMPRSGLWHRKTGHAGRKIRKPPPVEEVRPPAPPRNTTMVLHCRTEGIRGEARGRKRIINEPKW